MNVQRWAWLVWFHEFSYPVNVVAADEERAAQVGRGALYGPLGCQVVTFKVKRLIRCEAANVFTHASLPWDCLPDQRGDG